MTGHRRYVVDGRFLAAPPTGLHRVARGFVVAARDAGVDARGLGARGTTTIHSPTARSAAPGGRVGGRVWEQVVLPAAAARPARSGR